MLNKKTRNVAGLIAGVFLTSAVTAAPLPNIPPPPPPAVEGLQDYKTYGAGVPLAEFIKRQLRGALNKPYVLSPAAAADTALISVDLSGTRREDILPLVREILKGMKYELRVVRGVYYVEKQMSDEQAANEEKELLVYKPRHRQVSAITSYFPLFPGLQFTSAAGMSVRALEATTSGVAPSNGQSGANLGSSFSSGATTFSQTEGDPGLLVVRGTKKEVKEFKEFLEKIDTKVPQVVVRAYVLEVRTTNNKESGIALAMSILDDKLKLSLGSPSAAGDSLRLSLPSGSISAAVSALAGNSNVRLVTAPVLRAADGSQAASSIGTDTPTLGAVTTQNGAATQSITYQSAGVLLTISPKVLEDSIKLKISQEVSSFVQTETGISGTPTKLRRSFVSDIVAKSGEVLLLGGLSDSTTAQSSSKNFSIFGNSRQETSQSDIVVLLSVELL